MSEIVSKQTSVRGMTVEVFSCDGGERWFSSKLEAEQSDRRRRAALDELSSTLKKSSSLQRGIARRRKSEN